MTYVELSALIKSKGLLIKFVAKEVGYTPPGLKKAINNETIELRSLKRLCEILNLNPKIFF